MKKKAVKERLGHEDYYETYGVLEDIIEEDVDLSLDDTLRKDIISGKRKRKLRNVSIKIDPLYLQSIKKIAAMRGFPYQTLMRQWLIKEIKKELKIA